MVIAQKYFVVIYCSLPDPKFLIKIYAIVWIYPKWAILFREIWFWAVFQYLVVWKMKLANAVRSWSRTMNETMTQTHMLAVLYCQGITLLFTQHLNIKLTAVFAGFMNSNLYKFGSLYSLYLCLDSEIQGYKLKMLFVREGLGLMYPILLLLMYILGWTFNFCFGL